MASFTDLSAELISEIASYFCLHCTTQDRYDHHIHLLGLDTLLSLCQTSKRLCGVAQPVLFHHFPSNPLAPDLRTQFLLFIRSLFARPDLAKSPRYLWVGQDFTTSILTIANLSLDFHDTFSSKASKLGISIPQSWAQPVNTTETMAFVLEVLFRMCSNIEHLEISNISTWRLSGVIDQTQPPQRDLLPRLNALTIHDYGSGMTDFLAHRLPVHTLPKLTIGSTTMGYAGDASSFPIFLSKAESLKTVILDGIHPSGLHFIAGLANSRNTLQKLVWSLSCPGVSPLEHAHRFPRLKKLLVTLDNIFSCNPDITSLLPPSLEVLAVSIPSDYSQAGSWLETLLRSLKSEVEEGHLPNLRGVLAGWLRYMEPSFKQAVSELVALGIHVEVGQK